MQVPVISTIHITEADRAGRGHLLMIASMRTATNWTMPRASTD